MEMPTTEIVALEPKADACVPCSDLGVGQLAPNITMAPALHCLPEDDRTVRRLHVACKDFGKMHATEVEKWLSEVSPVPIAEVFKQKPWSYAFVTLSVSDSPTFIGNVHGMTFKGNAVTIADGHPRVASSKRPRDTDVDGRQTKKQKVGTVGQVPTLKELKEKARQRKCNGAQLSVVARSAPLLEWPYETQVSMKNTYAKTSLRSLSKAVVKACEDGGLAQPAWTGADWSKAAGSFVGCGCPLAAPLGCPVDALAGYRNKCEFTIARNEAKDVEVGFVLRVEANGSVIVADCQDVPPVPDQMKLLCVKLRESIRSSEFLVLDRQQGAKNSSGVWRLVTARMTPAGEMLVLMQTTTLDEERIASVSRLLVQALEPPELGVVSIFLQFNDECTDAVRPGASLLHIHGKSRITMPLLGSNFALGPLCFWNPNTALNAALYERALDWLNPDGNTIVLDACCGMGTYAILCCVRGCQAAIGVDVSEMDIEAARENAVLNGVSNASFRVGKLEDVLPAVLGDLPTDAKVYAIIDPPRPGVHHRALSAMKRCSGLQRIVYVSCNPDSLAEDAAKLCIPDEIDPFVPVRAVVVDTFPHTLQFEMVMQLDRTRNVIDPRTTPTRADVETGSFAADG